MLEDHIKRYSIQIVPKGEEFELSSGQKSRVYVDLKKAILRAEVQPTLAGKLGDAAGEFRPTAFAGVVLGGCHLASLTATYNLHADVIYVRKEAKSHGTKNLIEAPEMDKETSRVVLLEDVTTTANSALKALKILQSEGYNVVGIITVVDRRDSWLDSDVEDEIGGVPFRWLFRLEQLVESDPSLD